MNNDTVKTHFDTLASSYDRYKEKNWFYYLTLKRAIRENLEAKKGMAILDIGCGTGDILSFLDPDLGLGVDISTRMIAIAKRKHIQQKSLSFRVHDIEKKPIKGNFDNILMADVIEHLTDIHTALKNTASSMTSNTRLIITMANPYWEAILMILEQFRLKMPEGQHRRISEKKLIALLGQNNLQLMGKKTYLPSFRLRILQNLSLVFVYTITKVP